MEESMTIEFCGRPLTISTGALAKQADGSVVIRYGDTVLLVTAVAEKEEATTDFLPLTVNYQEMAYAAGKFPGGFFKREGRPSEREVLTSRLIDRPLAPLVCQGLPPAKPRSSPRSFRRTRRTIRPTLGIIGASAALVLSPVPFLGPVAAVKVGRKKSGEFIINPTAAESEESDLDIVVAGTKDAIMMVEGEASFIERGRPYRGDRPGAQKHDAPYRDAGAARGEGGQDEMDRQRGRGACRAEGEIRAAMVKDLTRGPCHRRMKLERGQSWEGRMTTSISRTTRRVEEKPRAEGLRRDHERRR